MKKLIIFDLDGTLVDTSPGIFNSVRYTERKMGFNPIPDSDLRKFVGPPLKPNYMNIYGVDEATAVEATMHHKTYGREKGFLEANLYDGIEELLDRLREKGYSLAVATLKNENTAHLVLDNVRISDKFDIIVGQDETESRTKADTIHIAMNSANCEDALLIGDSIFDEKGALAAGIEFKGVSYGFGFEPGTKYLERVEDIYGFILGESK